jgi:class 3 adenylate cyclase/tetratricopeptide (TPR) repeat protein
MEPIVHWLEGLGLGRYGEAFVQAEIDATVLPDLSEADLERLGVVLGHRKKLLRAIASLRDASEPSVAVRLRARPDAERRQVSVMFCDMVGSTELATRLDPEDLGELIGRYHVAVADAVRRFDGYIAKYMGDGALVYFGFPGAHEDDTERAARAGLAVTEAVRGIEATEPLQVRIGIATGLVVVGDLIGEGEAQERGVIGETPNLAARLQALAEPGMIVIAATTRQLLGNRFKLRELGRHKLKGFAEPIEAWAVEGVSVAESRFESAHSARLTGFVGREHELGLLLERWGLAQDGEGQVVLLSGEPGIGKSRIMSELRRRLERGGARSLRLHCSPYYVNSAFYPIIDNFERAFQFDREETAEERLDKLEALIVDQYGRPREEVRFIATMLSIACEARYGATQMTPQKFKDETLRALVQIVEAIAHRQSTIMLFEDVHWADPTTLETLDLQIQRLPDVPLLIVLTHRPEFANRWAHHGHVATLSLTKLPRAQAAAMVSRIVSGKTLPDDLVEQIIAKTDGVPLFVEELTKSILESGALRDAGGCWEYAGAAGALAIPLTLRDSLMARLDRFDPVREVAQIGAAIGREFSYELLAAVSPHARPELDQALSQLVETGLAFRRGTLPEAVYTFKHALVQDAAYDSMLKRRRQQLHASIARVIEARSPHLRETEPELLAHHYTEAKQPESAIPLWQKAGNLALRRMALAEATAHLNKGLELVAAQPPSEERDGQEVDLRCALSTAYIALQGWQAREVWDSLYPALPLAHSLRREDALLPILHGLWVSDAAGGKISDSLRWITQIVDAAECYRDPDLLILRHLTALISFFWLGKLTNAREHADQLLTLYTNAGNTRIAEVLNCDPKTLALLYSALAAWMLGYPEQAVEISDAMDRHARRRGHPFDLGFALTLGAMVFSYLGRSDQHLQRVQEAERLGRENSLRFLTEIQVPRHCGIALIGRGVLAEGIVVLEKSLAVWERSGGGTGTPYYKSVLAEGVARTGDLDGALDLINTSVAQVERPGWEERSHYAEILRIKGWLLSLKGDPEGAERSYLDSLCWARQQQAKSWELRTATSYARLMRDRGRAREAYELLAPVYGWFTEGFATRDLKEARALLDELRRSWP